MQKTYESLQEYHDTDLAVAFRQFSGDHYRIGLLSETSSDVTFTATRRNALILDLSGTRRHLTQMDGLQDETPTRRGDSCLVPQGLQVRFAWDVIDERQTSVTLEFDSALLGTFVPEFDGDRFASGHLLPGKHAQRPLLTLLLRLMRHEIHPKWRRGRLFSDSVMRLLALEVARSHWSAPMRPPAPDRRPDPRVRRALDYIEANFAANLSLADIGQASGLSLTQLTAQFQRQTGMTPYSFVIDRRLRKASELLRLTDMPIAQVAVECGFSDQQHLTRLFRARLKTTPGQVRRR